MMLAGLSSDMVPFRKEMQCSLHVECIETTCFCPRPRRRFLPTGDTQTTAGLGNGWYGDFVEGRLGIYM